MTADQASSAASDPELELNPGTKSWVPRAHKVSWLTLLVTTLAILMTSIDGGILPAVLPEISAEYGLNAKQGGLINSAFFAALVVGGILFGIIADRVGTGYRRTWTWNIAMLLAILGGLLTWGATTGFLLLLIWRIPMGLSRGGSEPVNVALVSEWWPKEHRGFALGVHHTGFPIGQFATGALIAVILGTAGWREAFLLIPLLGIIIIVMQSFIGTKKNQQKVYDWIDENHLTRPLPELSTKLSGGIMAPVREALKSANVRWAVVLVFLFLWGEAGAVTFLTTQFVQQGMSAGQAALIAGASGLTGWIGQVVWGTVSDHVGRKFSIVFLIIGWSVALLAMIFITGVTSAWLVLLFWGLFRNAPFPVVYALLIDSVPKAAGTAMGIMIGIALGLSGVFASLVAGAIIDAFGFTTHYIVLAAIVALALIPLSRIKETVAGRGKAPGCGPMSGLLEQGASLEKVATGTTWAEGPVWVPERRAVRYSDIPGDRIMEFSEETGELAVYLHPAGFSNGRTLDLDGSVIQCSHGHRAVEREVDGVLTTLVDSWHGARLNSPNDVIVASDGSIWFSDPAYGIKKPGEGHAGEEEYGDRYVFRFEPGTGRLDPVVIDIEQPNGLAFSPDESLLYVADSSLDSPGPPSPSRPDGHAIHVYDVLDGRHAKNGRLFVEVSPGLPDGFRVDLHGNVWSSSLDSVQVFSPAGELIERVEVPERIANVCFGGDDGQTLYIVASTSLYRIRTTVTDAVQQRRRS